MSFRDVLLLTLAAVLVAVMPVLAVQGTARRRIRSGSSLLLAAGVLLLVMFACLSGRSLGFGVDTAAYADLFAGYCSGQPLDDRDASFLAATWLLNGTMLGACDLRWLSSAWAFLVVVPLLCMREPWSMRLVFAAVLLFSLIGIELTTNALRQGLSVSACMLAISIARRRSLLALPIAVLAVLLHSSTSLVLVALAVSLLPWRLFLLAMVASVGVIAQLVVMGFESELLRPLLYEIQKYLMHDADEIWVRVLAYTSVLATLACPLVVAERGRVSALLKRSHYQIALRLTVACLPFLSLPYFGYRMIYGLYPLVLYFTLLANRRDSVLSGKQFALLLTFNSLMLLTWAQASSAMRDVPFFD